MTFAPIIPAGGLAGWAYLNRTMERQEALHARSPALQRDTSYFRDRIRDIETAEALVADRRLLRVTLGAFGLDADIDHRAFIRKILEEGALDPQSLGNRLADKRYLEMSRAFGFGDNAIPVAQQDAGFADRILSAYKTRQFEIAVGTQDNDMRIALTLRRELPELAARSSRDETLWFTVMGNPPLRAAFETAFNLPKSFGALDIDQQLTVLRDRAERNFGRPTIAQFADPERLDQLVRRFQIQSQLRQHQLPAAVGASPALQLLQSMQSWTRL